MLSIEAIHGIRTFMISFRRGDYIIEELREMLKKEGIDAALITSGIGSFDICKLHTILTTSLPPEDCYFNIEGPVEVGALHGSVAGGEPHIHIVAHDTLNDKVYIGHLEEGTRCCYRVELGLIVLSEIKTKRITDTTTGLIDIVEAAD
jgi:predicted DNA-binding protein with PD1-like motif